MATSEVKTQFFRKAEISTKVLKSDTIFSEKLIYGRGKISKIWS